MSDDNIQVRGEDLRKLGVELDKTYSIYVKDRKGVELQWLKNLRQFNGLHDPDVEFQPNQSKAYPRMTRVKVVSMVARLMSLLFPSGEKNWGLSRSPAPSFDEEALRLMLERWQEENPEAEFDLSQFDTMVNQWATEASTKLERYIDDQLGDMGAHGPSDYASVVKKVVRSGVMLGMGVLKGPMTISEERGEITLDERGMPMLGTATGYRPYFEFVPCWNYYPDLSAKTPEQQDGEFVRHIFSRHQLRKLAAREDFKGDEIRKYLRKHQDGNYVRREYEKQLAGVNEETLPDPTGKFEVIEYWGHVSGHQLKAAGIEVPDNKLDADIKASIWLLDKRVIKAAESPFSDDFSMFHKFLFEEDDVKPTGVGLPEIMRDSQMALGAMTRMLLDNASVVCGPNVEVDIDQMVAGQDYNFAPFKTWFKEGTGQGRAVQSVSFDSHLNELLAGIRLFSDFADTETFVGPATGGDTAQLPSEGMRTTGGASMIMASAALPFRDVVRNFDRFTVSVINSLVRWNDVFNEDTEIVGDLRPVGRGATTLMAKEIRAYSLDNLAQTLLEEERDFINMEGLARQRLATRDLPLDELMVDNETAKQNREARLQSQQMDQEQMMQRFEEEMRNLRADTFKQLAQGKKNLDGVDIDLFRAIVDAMEAGQDVGPALEASGSGAADGRSGSGEVQSGGPAGAIPTQGQIGPLQ